MSDKFIEQKIIRENDALQKVLKRLIEGVKAQTDDSASNSDRGV